MTGFRMSEALQPHDPTRRTHAPRLDRLRMSDHYLDGIARAIFTRALDTDRAGELLGCLFDGGSVTIDARTDELVLLPADQLVRLRGEGPS